MGNGITGSLDLKSVAGSLVIGLIAVFGLGWVSGSTFAALPFPVLSLLSGFILSGMVAGLLSKDETIAEPVISSVIVSLALYYFLPGLNLQGFADIHPEHILLIGLNGIMLSFAGAWAGEMLQGTMEGNSEVKHLEWGWVLAGTILGVMVSILVSTLLIIFLGFVFTPLMIAFVIGLFITGFLIGYRSAGVTIMEAALAGLFTLVINVDILTLALVPPGFDEIMFALILGGVLSMIGAWIGEKVQG
ncbi:MAG: hypothetical protein LW818_03580 [Ignavibacteriae bacterium]|jgi:hypothetical protein|nr:hypothetical protein [Ignavibacteriota bacterium]